MSNLLCQQNSYVREVTHTTVQSCTPVQTKEGVVFEIALQQTPFFPESGGQPCDQGSIKSLDGTSTIQIEAVERRGDVLVHLARQALQVGCKVSAHVAWQRRYDHMQQHTGQHLLSAVLDSLYAASTVSWELHPSDMQQLDSVAVDLAIDAITQDQIDAVEQHCCAEIRANRTVKPVVVDPSTAPDELQRLVSSPNFRGQLPPADKIKGNLRLIEIEYVDINACGGTHLKSTAEIQLVKVVGVERTRGQTRLRFVCGDRALAAFGRCLTREARLNARLSCPAADHEKAVELLQAHNREGDKVRKALAKELAALLGKALLHGPPADGAANVYFKRGAAVAYHRSASDLDFLQCLATAALESQPDAVLLLTADNANGSNAKAPVDITFLVAGPPELAKAVGPRVATALGGKGGGRPGRFQGKAQAGSWKQAQQTFFAAYGELQPQQTDAQ